ncbi:MAG: hypothetical protein Q8M98_06255 [Candidatus Cloacimonadaceae bacterium]|nr:hypothetical protein [Candidatus Cloacimonadaceae bacterium]MDP3114364.1 hypothetical protein [Candidatus Cloacimonadaceae bacterium]
MFKLDEIHLEAAQLIAAKHRVKKSCGNCYDRGWIGVSEQNLLVLCTRCVDMEKAVDDWKTYVTEHDDLKEHFSELFEEKHVEEEETDHVLPPAHEHRKDHLKSRDSFVPGQKRMGRTKKI